MRCVVHCYDTCWLTTHDTLRTHDKLINSNKAYLVRCVSLYAFDTCLYLAVDPQKNCLCTCTCLYTVLCYAEFHIAMRSLLSVHLSVSLSVRYRDHVSWNTSKIKFYG